MLTLAKLVPTIIGTRVVIREGKGNHSPSDRDRPDPGGAASAGGADRVPQGSVQKVGGLGRKRYDRSDRCRLGDRAWGGCCGWSRRGPTAGHGVSMCWRSAGPTISA